MLGVDLKKLIPIWRPSRGGRRAAAAQKSGTVPVPARPVDGSRHPLFSTPPTLRDPDLNARLRTHGYLVVDLLDADGVAELRSLADDVHDTPRTGWVTDFYEPDPAIKRAIADGLRRVFRPSIERLFVDHHSILHNFVLNWPGEGGGLKLHQHSSVIDDTTNRSVLMWCAVSRTTEENGTLHVIPRSHLIQQGPCPERAESWHEQHEPQLLRDHLVSVPLEPGQALIFDNQLLHCSFSNSTDEPRVAAAVVVIPSEADMRYYEIAGEDAVRIYRLDPDFFIDNPAGELLWAEPDGLELIEEVAWAPTSVSPEDLAEMLPSGTCTHADVLPDRLREGQA
jgi:ectoine hydroxylase-related dioxygenase (phytanoyl-CoA dioxygenase family)